MSAPTNGYSIRLVYYGRADLFQEGLTKKNLREIHPQVSTQNIRIVPFSCVVDGTPYESIAIYELVKNAEAPKSDLEGTKIG